jgi:hypothetical protein
MIYGLAALLMASPAAIPFEGRRFWMPQFGLGLLILIVLTIRARPFRPESAFLLLSTFVASGWLAYVVLQIRTRLFGIYAEEWRYEPWVGVALAWFLVFLLSLPYFPIVFVRGIIKANTDKRYSIIGLVLWVLQVAVVFWFTWLLQEAI